MSATDPYFQFPLVALAFGDSVKTRLETVIDYCLVETGTALRAKLSKDDESNIIGSFTADRLPRGFRKADQGHRNIVIGMHYLQIRGGGIEHTLAHHAALEQFIYSMRTDGKGFPNVRIKTRYVWEVRDDRGMSYREFAVLAGVYAIIGEKGHPVWITRSRIRAAAMGYKSVAMLEDTALLAQRTDGAEPLTINQLRKTLDTLEAHGHFARVQGSARNTYFSHRMTRADLGKKVEEWKTRPKTILAANRQEDRERQARIRAVNDSRKTPPNHHYNSDSITGDSPETATASAPQDNRVVTANPTAIIETSSEKPSSYKPLSYKQAGAPVEQKEEQPIKEPSRPLNQGEVEQWFSEHKKPVPDAILFAPIYWDTYEAKGWNIKGDWKSHALGKLFDWNQKRRQEEARKAAAE